SLLSKEATPTSQRATPSGLSERCFQRVLLATFSIRPLHATSEALSPPFSHFDPFGTEFREPGRVSHPLQRSFQLAPEFLASTRQSRLNSSYTDVECDCDLLVRKTFNVAQHYCLSINPLQSTQRLPQCSFTFVSNRALLGITGVTGTQLGNDCRVSGCVRGIDRNCRVAMSPPP